MKTRTAAALPAILLLFAGDAFAEPPAAPAPETPSQKYAAQLDRTELADYELDQASLDDAIALIQKRAREADPKTDPVPIKIDLPQPSDRRVTIMLHNIPEIDILLYVTQLCDVRYTISAAGVTILPLRQLTRQYYVPEEIFGDGEDDVKYRGTLEHFEVTFPAGASAAYDTGKNILTLRDTPQNLGKTADLSGKWRKPPPHTAPAKQRYTAQLEKTTIAQADFKDTPLLEALDTIMKKAREADPESTPVPLAICHWAPGAAEAAKTKIRVTLSVKAIPERKLLDYLDALAGHYRICKEGVIFLEPDPSELLLTWEYMLPEKFPVGGMDDAGYRKRLADAGVAFPEGASLHLDAAQQTLTIRDTQQNLELVDQILDAWDSLHE